MLLLLEWLLLFVGFPLAAYFDVFPVSKFLIFAVPVFYALGIAFFSPREELQKGPPAWRLLALRLGIVVAFIFAFCALLYPARLLHLPRNDPTLWRWILLLYPLISALPQEFLYRRFYFQRYAKLFPATWIAAASNIFAFAFLHIMYDNAIAILFTLAGGTLLTFTWLKTRRLTIVWLEHSVYGLAVFTSGLGLFFYEPIAAP